MTGTLNIMNKILVFTMGKVGSSSMIYALKKKGFEVDRGYKENIKELSPLADYQAVYTLVRDPIARNVSCYFETYGEKALKHKLSLEAIKCDFRFAIDDTYPLTWFDDVFFPIIGIDVYKYSYPTGAPLVLGKVCIMRTDQMIIEHRAKTEDTRPYGELYKEFLDWVKFDDEYVASMLGSKYVQHFFTESQIQEMVDRWTL
jgi:hypothetical protein